MPLAAAAQVEYIDPAGGFTQVVATTNAGVKTIFVSGQVGRGDTLRKHVESAFAARRAAPGTGRRDAAPTW